MPLPKCANAGLLLTRLSTQFHHIMQGYFVFLATSFIVMAYKNATAFGGKI
jgi:hypothetical protein